MSVPDLFKVRKDYTEDGDLFRIACDYLTSPEVSQYNDFRNIIVPSYYDLVYDCYDPPLELADRISERLLLLAAEHWKIFPDGEPCDGVPVVVDKNALVAISTRPGNRLVSTLSCQKLVPGDGECCTVVQNEMTFTPYPEYSEIDLWAYVKQQFDEKTLITEDEKFQAAFIGSVIETPKADGTDLDPPPSSSDSEATFAGIQNGGDDLEKSNEISAVGGVIMGGLVAALIGIALIVARRRRQSLRTRNVSEEDNASDFPRVDVLSDSKGAQEISHEVVSSFSDDAVLRVNVSATPEQNSSYDSSPMSDPMEYDSSQMSTPNNSYAWDLSTSFQREIMSAHGQTVPPPNFSFPQSSKGIHGYQNYSGPTTIEVVPPYSMEETSESEADSWAQTEGTVGSLDEDLEAITAEI